MSEQAPLHWYAAYTKPRNEKRVLERLARAGIEAYLPLLHTRRKWADRLKWVSEPLIRSYIFVRVNAHNYYDVLGVSGIVCYVFFEGKPAAIPHRQIETLQLLLSENIPIENSSERFVAGQKVIVKSGTLLGMEGEMVQYQGRNKVLVRLGNTGQSLLISISPELLENL